MKAMKQLWLAGLAVVALSLSACSQGPNMGGVAVLDLAAVAVALGEDVRINELVQVFAQQERQRLTELQSELRNTLQEGQKNVTDDSDDETKLKFARMAEQAQMTMRQELAKTEQAAKNMRLELSGEFRKMVEPTSSSVAQSRGLGIVMIRNPMMLAVDQSAEITEEVIGKLKASRSDVLSDVTPAAPEPAILETAEPEATAPEPVSPEAAVPEPEAPEPEVEATSMPADG